VTEDSKRHGDPPAAESASGIDRRFAGLDLVVDWNPEWSILDHSVAPKRLVYQPIADTGGIVFVRSAPDDTLEAYLAALGGGRTVTVERDERISHHGLDARRVRVRLPKGGGEMHTIGPRGPEHHSEPLSADTVVVIGFRLRGTPVLAGYRVPVDDFARLEPVLDAIIDSVRAE
jgi:hypothetical protein